MDQPARLLVAYGLIALMALFALAVVFWLRHNHPHRRNQRERARTAEYYRQRLEANAEQDKAAST